MPTLYKDELKSHLKANKGKIIDRYKSVFGNNIVRIKYPNNAKVNIRIINRKKR